MKMDYDGVFAVYHGIECQMVDGRDGTVSLATDNATALKYGFSESLPGWYINRVRSIELDCAYYKLVKGLYKGQVIQLLSVESDGSIYIGANGKWEIFEKLGFEFIDRDDYVKRKVPISDVSEISERLYPMTFVGNRWIVD